MKNYRDSDVAVNKYANGIENTVACSVLSAEAEYFNEFFDVPEQAAKEKRRRALAKKALDTLTETQRRRYIQHHAYGLTTREISKKECVSHVAIAYSLELAEKKLQKFTSTK